MGSLKQALESPAALRQYLALFGSPNSEVDKEKGMRLIHKVTMENNVDMLMVLFGYHVELEAMTNEGKTAVDLAVEGGTSYEALKLLLDQGANPNGGAGTPKKSESTVHMAVKVKHDVRFLHALLDKGANCDIPDMHQDFPIHRACLEENVQAVEVLLRHRAHECNRHGARGFTPLHIAANMSNAKLFLTILRFSPKLDLMDIQERTAIDIVLAKQETAMIEGMGHWMVNPVLKLRDGSLSASDSRRAIQILLSRPQGQRFLQLLRTIDTEFQHNFGHECNGESHSLEEHATSPLMNYIGKSEQYDINDYVDIVMKACSEGLGMEIVKNRDTVEKIADCFLRHIFIPQNESLLQEVKKLGMLWSAVVAHLENDIVSVYERSLGERRKDGIKGLVTRTCLNEAGKVNSQKLHKLVATLTRFWQLQSVGESDGEARKDDERLYAMRDPVQSLAVWSVLTGRLRLAPYFLRQEDFDMIPQALLLAKILRSLGRRRDIEDIYANKAVKVAITCEGIAIQALRRIKDVDVTPNSCLTMELVMLPLETFGGYSILELAARGESSSFVIIDIVQEALNRLWYKDFFFARKSARDTIMMEVAIACGFIPPLLPVLLFLMPRFRINEPDYVKLQPMTADPNSSENCKLEETQGDGIDVTLIPRGAPVRASDKRIGAGEELLRFYQNPSVKFRIHVLAHITFIILLSFVVMFQVSKDRMTTEEKICYLTLLGFFVEEINEMITSAREETIKDYFFDGWNVIDLTAITCGFTAFVLRVKYNDQNKVEPIQNYWALVLLTTTCLVYWVRLLYVSVVLESLGPKLKMMSLMVKKDFMPFLYILFVLMFGFGVTFHALQFPEGKSIQNSGPQSEEGRETAVQIMLGMFRHTFYAIVGEYALEQYKDPCNMSDITSGGKANDGDNPECMHPIAATLLPTVYMVLYIVIMQILLLNVIVAMFSKTIDAIDNESRAMWQFEKFDLIEEFNTRSALPPPFNTLSELRNLASYTLRKIRERHRRHREPKQQGQQEAAETPHDCKVYMLSLYYQALAFRGRRQTFNGVVFDEEDLDEGNKIIFQQVNAINEKLERFEQLEETVKKLEGLAKELKAINLRGPSNINPKRASIMLMPYIEEGHEP